MTGSARPDDLLEREARFIGSECKLLRFWETDVAGRSVAVIIYSHGYKSPGLAGLTSLRFGVYDGERQLTGGIIA